MYGVTSANNTLLCYVCQYFLKEKICVQETFVFLWRTFSQGMSISPAHGFAEGAGDSEAGVMPRMLSSLHRQRLRRIAWPG